MPRLRAFRRRRSSIVASRERPSSRRTEVVVAVDRVVDGAGHDSGTERLDLACNRVQSAQYRARQVAAEQVVAAGGQGDDVRRRRCAGEVGEDAVCRVAVTGEVNELHLARRLGASSAVSRSFGCFRPGTNARLCSRPKSRVWPDNTTRRFAGTFTGATGLEPATSGVTGRSWHLRPERGSAGIPAVSRSFRRWRCGDQREEAGASGSLVRDERGMLVCRNCQQTGA